MSLSKIGFLWRNYASQPENPGVRDVEQNTHQATGVNVAGQRLRHAPNSGNVACRTMRCVLAAERRAKVKTPTWTDGGLPTPCRVRSILCRFSEFRTSQCLTQFAAIFLDPRTEASTVANNIKFRLMPLHQTYKMKLRRGRTGEP